jgi:hypothetical protein
VIPSFSETINTPYLSNTQKEIFNKNKPDYDTKNTKPYEKKDFKPYEKKDSNQGFVAKTGDDKVLLNLQLYQPEQKKPPMKPKPPPFPMEPLAVTSPYFPPQYQERMNNLMKNFHTPYIYKDYNINIGGPNADHTYASMIYEDALPPSNIFSTFKFLKERDNLVNYIRGTFINSEEGEDIQFNGDKNSLNSRLKFLELNPFNSNKYSTNPYEGLPQNFIIYKSCYPIVYDKQSACVQCQKNSIGMNVRTYKLSRDEYIAKHPELEHMYKTLPRQNNRSNGSNCSSGNCRNAVIEIPIPKPLTTTAFKFNGGLMVAEQFGGDGDDAVVVADETVVVADETVVVADETVVVADGTVVEPSTIIDKTYEFNLWREIKYYEYIRNDICKPMSCPNFVQSYCYFINNKSQISYNKIKNKSMMPEKYSNMKNENKSLILLTESPTYNIYTWCSNSYTKVQNIQKQIYTGYKTDNVWESVLAQMLIVFYVMDKHNFTYNNVNCARNFFIKDLNIVGETSNFWLYIIDGISYYVPNTGNLLMFDSSFHSNNNEKVVISSKLFGDNKDLVSATNRTNAINCLTMNAFNSSEDCIKPSTNVQNHLNNVSKYLNNRDNNFSSTESEPNNNIMLLSLQKYLHNRTGTLLYENEIVSIQKNEEKPFKKGEMVVFEEKSNTYKFVIFYSNKDINNSYIISKSNNVMISLTANKHNIFHYSSNIIIQQESKPTDTVQSLDSIIETYYV